MRSILLVTFLVILAVSAAVESVTVRGVAPEKASLYHPDRPFVCLDGSATISFEQVNDDYCDCRDGSDEPGTPACMNGSFACQNLGYIVQYAPASRVNDGICDCCDGSDEYDSGAVCENKCVALAAQMRAEEEKARELRELGLNKRKELVNLGTEMKKSIQDKLAELEAQKAANQAQRAQLEETKNELEAKEKEAKERQDKANEEKRQALEKQTKGKQLFDLLDTDKDQYVSPAELQTHAELDILFDGDGQFTIDEAKQLLNQKERVDFDEFVSTFYEKLSPYVTQQATTGDGAATATTTTQAAQSGGPSFSTAAPIEPVEPLDLLANSYDETTTASDDVPEDSYYEEHEADSSHADHEDDAAAAATTEHDETHVIPPNPSVDMQSYDASTQELIQAANKARDEMRELEQRLRDIDSAMEQAKKKLGHDVGDEGQFATMIDKCFEYEDREYVYKLCPFDRTVQKSKANSGETSIGYWKGWSPDANASGASKYKKMKFENGQGCWNGPARSTLVLLSCGAENKLTAVSEPNRCEYEMKFETPAVCDSNEPLKSSEHTHEDL